MDVELIERSDLAEFLFFQIVSPDVRALVFVAVGEEVQGRPVPHGKRIDGIIAGNIFGRQRLQIE